MRLPPFDDDIVTFRYMQLLRWMALFAQAVRNKIAMCFTYRSGTCSILSANGCRP